MNEFIDDTTTGVSSSRRPLYPASIAYLIEERPLIWYEDPQEYDQLRLDFFAELKPVGALNSIFVKNVVDYVWELRRMKKMKHTAINCAMPNAATKLLKSHNCLFGDPDEGDIRKQSEAAAYGLEMEDTTGGPDLEERMRSKRVTAEMIHYKALNSCSDEFHWISRECERLEGRFHRLLKDYEERNATLAAMAKSLVERERAKFAAFSEVN